MQEQKLTNCCLVDCPHRPYYSFPLVNVWWLLATDSRSSFCSIWVLVAYPDEGGLLLIRDLFQWNSRRRGTRWFICPVGNGQTGVQCEDIFLLCSPALWLRTIGKNLLEIGLGAYLMLTQTISLKLLQILNMSLIACSISLSHCMLWLLALDGMFTGTSADIW